MSDRHGHSAVMDGIERPRLPLLHTRNLSTMSVESDSSVSSPDRGDDEDTNFFMTQANDSQSSLGIATIRESSSPVDVEREHRLTPISKLPPELLIGIFAKLTTTGDLRNCMLVSYNWAIHTVGILWHRPLCNKWRNLENVAAALSECNKGFFPYHELVRRLNLSAIADKISDGTVMPFMHCKRVERLTLTNCAKLTDGGVKGLVEGNKYLQALDVTDLDQLTDETMNAVAENCLKLQGLNISNCSLVTDESLIAISMRCRQLKRLKLNNVYRATDTSITSFAQNCRSILEIDLAACQAITSSSVTALLSHLSHLRELRLAHCSEITDSAFLNLPPRLQFDSLRILDLTACEQVRDDAIARIIPAAPRLRNLVLAKCRNITDRAVLSICKLTKNLHYIHLGHCLNLTDAAVINLVKACNRIRYIDLACCGRLTDASVVHLAQLPKLRRIGLVKCQQLTDRSIFALAKGPYVYTPGGKNASHMPHFCSLERVHLSYCINLTLKGITALLQNCPRLTHLSLTGVQAFLREDLTFFCRDAPAEFTHPQRDVFCVFSGEGVQRLREHLLHMARMEAEREGREAMEEENLLDGEESPSADNMSDDDTIDGNDNGHDFLDGHHPHGVPIPVAPRPRARRSSLQDLPSYVELPLLPLGDMQRMGPATPGLPSTPEMRDTIGPAHLNLMSSSHVYQHDPDYDLRSRSPGFNMRSARDARDRSTSRAASRRHTIESGSDAYGPVLPPSLPSYAGYGPESARQPSDWRHHDDDPRRSLFAPSSMLMPPTMTRRSSGQAFAGPSRLGPSPGHPFLRPDPNVSAFEVNYDAIMSTIPRSRTTSRTPSRSNSPHLSRVSSRPPLGGFHVTDAALLPAPGFTAHRSSSRASSIPLSRQSSRMEEEEQQMATFRALMAADAAEQLRVDGAPSVPRSIELPLLGPDVMVSVQPPATTRARSVDTSPHGRTGSGSGDVHMTQ